MYILVNKWVRIDLTKSTLPLLCGCWPLGHKISPDFDAIHNNANCTTLTMPKESVLVEGRNQEALQCRQENPNRSIAFPAKEDRVPYHRLYARLSGTPSRVGHKATCSRLSKAQEHALCTYTNSLEYTRLSVRRSFI